MRFFSLKQRGSSLISEIIRHLDNSYKTVEKFHELYMAIVKNDINSLNRIYLEIDSLESEVDKSRRKLANELCSGSMFAYMREDFLDLIEKIDSIADAAKDAAKTIVDSLPSENAVRTIFTTEEMESYIMLCLKTVKTLGEALHSLAEKGRESIPIIMRVEEFEEEADNVKASLIRKLFQEADKLKVLEVIQIKDFINIADNICDSAEDASDIMLQIIAKGYG